MNNKSNLLKQTHTANNPTQLPIIPPICTGSQYPAKAITLAMYIPNCSEEMMSIFKL